MSAYVFCRGALVLQGSDWIPTLCPVWTLMNVMKCHPRYANTSARTLQAPTSVTAIPTSTWSRMTQAARQKVLVLPFFNLMYLSFFAN